MPLGTTAELDFMLAECGVAVSYAGGAQTTYGLLDRAPLQGVVDGGLAVIGHTTTLTIRAGSLTGLAQDTSIVAGGTTFTIREVGFTDDDGTQTLELVDP